MRWVRWTVWGFVAGSALLGALIALAPGARSAGPVAFDLVGRWSIPAEGLAGGDLCPRYAGYDQAGRLVLVSSCQGVTDAPGARQEGDLTLLDGAGAVVRRELLNRGSRLTAIQAAALAPGADALFYAVPVREEVLRRDLAPGAAPAAAWPIMMPSGRLSGIPAAMAAGADGSLMLFAEAGLARYGPGDERRGYKAIEVAPGVSALPGSVAVDRAGAVYVTDARLAYGVRKFTHLGAPVADWSAGGEATPAGPLAAYPGRDEIFVLSGESQTEVRVLAPDGGLLRALPVPAGLRASPRPLLAVAPDGGYALVGDWGAETVAHQLGPDGSARGRTVLRRNVDAVTAGGARVDVAPDGRVAVLAGDGRLRRFAADGAVLSDGTLPLETLDLAWLPDGGLVTASDAGGAYAVTRWAADGAQGWRRRFQLYRAQGLAADDRRLYAPDVEDGSVMALDPADGALVGRLAPGAGTIGPGDLDLGAEGRLVVLDRLGGTVTTLPTGASPEPPAVVNVAGRGATAVAAGPAGLLALVASGGVAVLDATGAEWWRLTDAPAGYRAVDVAFAVDGRLTVLLEQGNAPNGRPALEVRVYRQAGAPPPTPPVPPPPTPPAPDDGACRVAGDKTAWPADIRLGETVTVTLALRGGCPEVPPAPADIVLVVDVSGSMLGVPEAAAGTAVQAFLDEIDLTRHRVGVAVFSDDARLVQSLTDNPAVLRALPLSFGAAGGTAIDRGLIVADGHLRDAGRPGVQPVIVLLSDGGSPEVPALAAAEAARSRGVLCYTVALGDANVGLLLAIAGSSQRLFRALGPAELADIYRAIATAIGRAGRDVLLWDALGPDVALVAGSVAPAPWSPPGDAMVWRHDRLPAAPVTVTYRVRPLVPGRVPTNREAWFDYRDVDGALRRFVYPVPFVNVRGPTPTPSVTPTATATPTPTATPVPGHVFLPLLERDHCFPAVRHADVVLALDTSSSMTGDKLASAVAAARLFLDQLRLPEDRAAIVAYSGEAAVLAPLGATRPELDAALAGIQVRMGTRIDRALDMAGALLLAPDRPGDNLPVLVLLSDGRHVGDLADVRRAAAGLAAGGVVTYTVAFGDDADGALLVELAGAPERALSALDAATLAAVYRQIAGAIVCR